MRVVTFARLPRTAGGRAAAAVAGIALACAGILAAAPQPPAVSGLLTEGIADNPCHPQQVIAVPPGTGGRYAGSSSVLLVRGHVYLGPGRLAPLTPAETNCVRASVRASESWLAAGTIPGGDATLQSMATRALLDLRLSVRPDGAVISGWHPGWQYSWPRDSSWVAAALAATGHAAAALRILRFLQRVQLADGGWAARYWPDGSGPVAGRPAELDAVGWVPWAVWSWAAAQPSASRSAPRGLAALWPMVSAAADKAVRSLSADGLPVAAMDYWEDSVQVTLGTAAPLLAGLRAAADVAAELGGRARAAAARRWSAAAARLSGAIETRFGRYGYGRLPGPGSGADAAVTFLGGPFATATAAVQRAAAGAQRALTLTNGGLLPGSAWPGDTTAAWTAETAFFALFWAAAGQHSRSAAILSWLAAHRTRLGALPEQVTAQDRPASVAPLAWTDAVVLLALVAQQGRLPVLPVPPDQSATAR
jgi:glucoamylase